MNDKRIDTAPQKEGTLCASGEVWVSKNTEVDEEIDREAREFLNEVQESKKNNRMIVGWRPE